jgi:superfamily II DNA helicase RecQ
VVTVRRAHEIATATARLSSDVVQTPEMFTGKRWQEAFFGSKNVASRLFGLLVIDEAHTVVDEGLARGPQKHCGILKRADLAFRPCYQDIWQVLRWLRCRVLLTSATLAPESQDLLLDVLRMPTSSVSRISVPLHRPGLRLLRVKANGGLAHARDARRSIDGRQAPSVAPHPPTIIYSNTRRATGSVNRQVHEAAHDTIAADSKLCRRVHGNTAKLDRTRAIDDFAAGLLAILSGTSAIGLGMNLCVRLVIQLGLCGIADLMQRFGRAGRDDRPALCAVFCGRMPRQYLARRTTSAFTPEDRAMYDLGITEVCLWLCFLCYAECVRPGLSRLDRGSAR